MEFNSQGILHLYNDFKKQVLINHPHQDRLTVQILSTLSCHLYLSDIVLDKSSVHTE